MSRVTEVVKQLYQRASTQYFSQCMKSVQLLSAVDGRCKAQFTVDDQHINISGTLHGGFISTVIDCISSYALASQTSGDYGASVDLHVTFLKAAFPGDTVVVDAKTLRAGKKIAFLKVELTKNNGKDVIARGQHTKYFLNKV